MSTINVTNLKHESSGSNNIVLDSSGNATASGNLTVSGNATVSGTLANTGNLTITSGNLVLSNGNGIDFSAAGNAAGMTSELLNDYEEGTWTPTLGGTATYTVQTGTYTKIGRFVYVSAMITVNTLGTGSTREIQGLPFSINGSNNDIGAVIGYVNACATSYVSMGSNNYINSIILGAKSAASTDNGSAAVFGNGTAVRVTFTYFT